LTAWIPAGAGELDREFSGKWVFSPAGSRTGSLPIEPEPFLEIAQSGPGIRVASEIAGVAVKWTYLLNGDESKYRIGEETRNSAVKWEGAALLINTLVSGKTNYTIMDRWWTSADGATLVVSRHVVRGGQETEGVLLYRHPGDAAPASKAAPASAPALPKERIEPALTSNPDLEIPEAFAVRAGTRFVLSLLNSVDTKHSHEGDRVYLEMRVPVIVNKRIVIPRGSNVVAVVTVAKAPGKVKGKGELYLRFETLTLPNGVTRDFRSRLVSADAGVQGDVDSKEGKITSPGNKTGDARTVGTTTAAGAGIGGLAGAVGGNAGAGMGIGAAAGAAAGLAGIFNKRGPDASLPRGTTVEMLLDRDLLFQSSELRF
jgi:type IV secretion system protein VirB10